MEFTQIKGTIFGYKKVDVVQYISELNELHTAQLQNKKDELEELKKANDGEINSLKAQNEELELKVNELKEQLNSVQTELNSTLSALELLKNEHNSLLEETTDLRDKSEFIATAIIKAEKCAGLLVNEARSNATEIVNQAHQKVEAEKQKLEKAKEYVSDIRAQFNNLATQINTVLGSTEAELNVKISSIEKASK